MQSEGGPRKASLTGMSNGLSVELNLDQSNYMKGRLSKKAGARLVLHDPFQPPLPDEYGMDLAPNTASAVGVTLVSLSNTLSNFTPFLEAYSFVY